MGTPARISLKVRYHEIDLYGHVNHAHYVHYFETGRVEALEALGLALPDMRRQGYMIVASEIAVKYHAPAVSGDTLEVITWIREVRGARSFWTQEIRDAASGDLRATAEVVGAFVSEQGRPVRVPPAFLEKLSPIIVPPS